MDGVFLTGKCIKCMDEFFLTGGGCPSHNEVWVFTPGKCLKNYIAHS